MKNGMHQPELAQSQSIPTVRKIVGARAVQQRVVYTIPGMLHLEAAGQFPKHFNISQWRVAWFLDEVLSWMQSKVDARAEGNATAQRVEITERDRFIDFHEASARVLLTTRTLCRLEARGQFPKRIALGPRRVAYLEREVLSWIETRATQANSPDELPPTSG